MNEEKQLKVFDTSKDPSKSQGGGVHLCGSCYDHFEECHPEETVFGNGYGNDNVTRCTGYKARMPKGGVGL
jgi:hypothetical protein